MESCRSQIFRRVVIGLVFAAAFAGIFRVAALPAEQLALHIAVDDAFYYLTPARHLLAGRDYSLDGETRTNGVQPLWALISIGLCAALPSDGADVRALVMLSGFLWLAAGVVVYLALRPFGRWLALVATSGFVLTGFGGRVALQGMENGLHALLCALLVWMGVRCLHRQGADSRCFDRPAFYLGLGLLLALITLARIDSAVLAIIIAVLILAGLVRPGGDGRPGWNLRGTILLALPGVLLVGGFLLLSHFYFGTAFPISGTLKMYYQSVLPTPHSGALGSILCHLKLIFRLTTIPVAENVEQLCWRTLGITATADHYRLIFLVLLLTGAMLLGRRFWRRRGTAHHSPAWTWYAGGLCTFALVHLLIYATRLSRFTDYGTWYFSPESISLWVLYAVLIIAVARSVTQLRLAIRARGSGRLPASAGGGFAMLVVLLMLGAALMPIWQLGDDNTPACIYHTVGRWLDTHLPAETRVACFSAGIVSYTARSQRVINLDGLMNNRDYFENYLKQHRIDDYLRDRQVEYFCDYASRSAWRRGRYWSLDLTGMQLVRWWPMLNDLSYAVWRIRPSGAGPADVLDAADGPCDRFSQIQFAADVLGRYPVVPEDQLSHALGQPDAANLRVITSIVTPPPRQLRHVLVPKAPSPQTRVRPTQIDPLNATAVTFGGALRLVGFDMPDRVVSRGQRLVITRYWMLASPDHDYRDISIELWLHPARPEDLESVAPDQRLVHHARPCHGTYPVWEWGPGEVISETYGVHIPEKIPRGHYPVMLVLWDARHGWLLPEQNGADASHPGLFLGNIEIR